MPYNNTPIAPPTEATGQVSMPLARIKKIIAADPQVAACSQNASFVIALAAEMFVQYLADQTLAVVRGERRPRRNIQYRDLAHAIARVDNLEFLVDVAPRLVTVKDARRLHAPFAEHDARWAEADREQARVVDEAEQLSKQDQQAMDGTSTLDGNHGATPGDAIVLDDDEVMEDTT